MKKKDKRIIYGAAGAFLILLLIIYVVVPFFSDVFEIGDKTTSAEKRFLRMERLIKQKDFLNRDLAKVRKIESKILSRLYMGNDPNKIVPHLHAYLTEVASKEGLELRRLTNVKSKFVFSKKTLEKYPFLKRIERITVLIEARGRPDQMFKFIDDIEKSEKYLEFSYFAVNAWNMRPDKTVNFRAHLFTYFVKNINVPRKRAVRSVRKVKARK